MYFVLTEEEFKGYVAREAYDEAQQMLAQKTLAIDAMWEALDILPPESRARLIGRTAELQELQKAHNSPARDAGTSATHQS